MSEKQKRRVHLTLSKEVFDKVENVSERYGVTANAFIAFIVGQWIDSNYDLKDFAREKMIPAIAEKMEPTPEHLEKVFSNPKIVEMMFKEMFAHDSNKNDD